MVKNRPAHLKIKKQIYRREEEKELEVDMDKIIVLSAPKPPIDELPVQAELEGDAYHEERGQEDRQHKLVGPQEEQEVMEEEESRPKRNRKRVKKFDAVLEAGPQHIQGKKTSNPQAAASQEKKLSFFTNQQVS